jgi:hypothetical protein
LRLEFPGSDFDYYLFKTSAKRSVHVNIGDYEPGLIFEILVYDDKRKRVAELETPNGQKTKTAEEAVAHQPIKPTGVPEL